MDRRQFIRSAFLPALGFGAVLILDLLSATVFAATSPIFPRRKVENVGKLVDETLAALGAWGVLLILTTRSWSNRISVGPPLLI